VCWVWRRVRVRVHVGRHRLRLARGVRRLMHILGCGRGPRDRAGCGSNAVVGCCPEALGVLRWRRESTDRSGPAQDNGARQRGLLRGGPRRVRATSRSGSREMGGSVRLGIEAARRRVCSLRSWRDSWRWGKTGDPQLSVGRRRGQWLLIYPWSSDVLCLQGLELSLASCGIDPWSRCQAHDVGR
jgi:hypothetical protein